MYFKCKETHGLLCSSKNVSKISDNETGSEAARVEHADDVQEGEDGYVLPRASLKKVTGSVFESSAKTMDAAGDELQDEVTQCNACLAIHTDTPRPNPNGTPRVHATLHHATHVGSN